MFKIPNVPSPKAEPHELADFVELECIRNGSISMQQTSSTLNRLSENDYTEGVDEEDEISSKVESAFAEIEARMAFCNERYPFDIGISGYVLKTKDHGPDFSSNYWLYCYFLMATRLDMKKHRTFKDIDGSLLFEKVSAEIAKNYWGDRAESYVFGTASDTPAFQDKVNDLCQNILEGVAFKNRNAAPPTAKDDKLDVVVWKHFADKCHGKVIGFGQCKTGTNWNGTVAQLQPDSFCNKWLESSPTVTPIRLFFLCEALSRSRWYSLSSDAGVLFDRCRLMDYASGLDPDLLKNIRLWTQAALSHAGIN